MKPNLRNEPVDTPAVKRIVLDVIKNYLVQYIPTIEARNVEELERYGKEWAAQIEWKIVKAQSPIKETKETVLVPETWWDAFKIQYFKGQLLAWFPPKMREIVTVTHSYNTCPHLPTDPAKRHYEFLTMHPHTATPTASPALSVLELMGEIVYLLCKTQGRAPDRMQVSQQMRREILRSLVAAGVEYRNDPSGAESLWGIPLLITDYGTALAFVYG